MSNFSVKINSLGKILHRLRTSNSKLQRQIEALLKLAKEIKDESKFQKVIQNIISNFTPVCPSLIS